MLLLLHFHVESSEQDLRKELVRAEFEEKSIVQKLHELDHYIGTEGFHHI
jgi:hypothetical protein